MAGQPVPEEIRVPLERLIGECLRRDLMPEAVARLLARANREVSATNSAVGPNVMCTFVHRREVKAQPSSWLFTKEPAQLALNRKLGLSYANSGGLR